MVDVCVENSPSHADKDGSIACIGCALRFRSGISLLFLVALVFLVPLLTTIACCVVFDICVGNSLSHADTVLVSFSAVACCVVFVVCDSNDVFHDDAFRNIDAPPLQRL